MVALDIIKNLVKLVGTSAGIILFSIGAVMLLNSFLKLYVFSLETDSYFNPQRTCQQVEKKDDLNFSDEIFNEAEYSSCVERETTYAKETYQKRKKSEMIDGFSFLVVGTIIFIFYQKKKKKEN